jgi:transposase
MRRTLNFRFPKLTVLPKRWIVEHSIAWLNRCRRLAKDWENLNRSARLPALRLDPPHPAKALQPRLMFSDRL